MKSINASNARQNFFNLLADISVGDPMLITSKAGNCVLISEEEWGSIQETIYLMSNPKTRDDILEGIETPLSECEDELPW
ncbi:MAG: type II toxin-antitoxin system prevent-host-death family antitoxin [Holosporaceae bacterium]|jgi:prevent-host-death family protein|nr:type II toxin-antitoxin system prevent-host-death family antitoxin [Holosporaceae bacterium]